MTHPGSSQQERVLCAVDAHPKAKIRYALLMTEDRLEITGKSFGWAEINEANHRAIDNYLNGAYQNTSFFINVASPRQKATFMLQSGTKGFLKSQVDHEGRERNAAIWAQAVDILDAKVYAPHADAAIATIRQGGTVKIAGVRIDSAGLNKSGLFPKTVRWPEIAGTETKSGYFRIMARQGDKTKPRIQVLNSAWNIGVLIRVIAALGPRGR